MLISDPSEKAPLSLLPMPCYAAPWQDAPHSLLFEDLQKLLVQKSVQHRQGGPLGQQHLAAARPRQAAPPCHTPARAGGAQGDAVHARVMQEGSRLINSVSGGMQYMLIPLLLIIGTTPGSVYQTTCLSPGVPRSRSVRVRRRRAAP